MTAPDTREILVVDDDVDLRSTLAEILVDEGYSVTTAGNGREALEQLHGGVTPSMILLDLMMPVMDGWEFRRRQLAEPSYARLPVVVYTAHEDARDVASRMSAAAGIQKTAGIVTLLATIADVVDGRVPGGAASLR